MVEKSIMGSIGKLRPHMTELSQFLGVLTHALDFWTKLTGVLILVGREGHIAACILYDEGAFAPAVWQHLQNMMCCQHEKPSVLKSWERHCSIPAYSCRIARDGGVSFRGS